MSQSRPASPHLGSAQHALLPEEPSQLFNRDFVLAMSMQVLFGISFSSFLILPKFLKLELHASAQDIGAMAAASLGSAAFFSPLVGSALSRTDRRLILLVAVLVEAAAACAFTMVDRVGPLALALRCAQGFAFVAVFTGNTSLVADTVPDHQLGRALGYLGASMLVTNAVAPLIAEPVAARFGWNMVFLSAAAASLSTVVIITKLSAAAARPSLRARTEKPNPPPVGTLPIQLGSLLMGAGIGVMFTYTQPFALEQGAQKVGQLFLGYAVTATLVRIFLGGLSDRLGPARVAAFAMALYGITVLASAQLTPSTLIYLGMSLGLSHGLLYPALTSAGLCVVPRAGRSRFLGWLSFCFNLGFALTVLLLGPIADTYGYAPLFVCTGLCLLCGVFPLLQFGLKTEKYSA